MVVNSNDSAGAGVRQSGQRLRLEAFDVDLDEGGRPCARNQRVERRHRHADGFASSAGPPSRRAPSAALTKASEAVDTVGLSMLSLQIRRVPDGCADHDRLDHRLRSRP